MLRLVPMQCRKTARAERTRFAGDDMNARVLAAVALCGCVGIAGAVLSAAPDNPAAIARGRAHVQQNAATTFFGPNQDLVATDTLVDRDGTEHVRFARTYRGLR